MFRGVDSKLYNVNVWGVNPIPYYSSNYNFEYVKAQDLRLSKINQNIKDISFVNNKLSNVDMSVISKYASDDENESTIIKNVGNIYSCLGTSQYTMPVSNGFSKFNSGDNNLHLIAITPNQSVEASTLTGQIITKLDYSSIFLAPKIYYTDESPSNGMQFPNIYTTTIEDYLIIK